jgi:hypothetical protein
MGSSGTVSTVSSSISGRSISDGSSYANFDSCESEIETDAAYRTLGPRSPGSKNSGRQFVRSTSSMAEVAHNTTPNNRGLSSKNAMGSVSEHAPRRMSLGMVQNRGTLLNTGTGSKKVVIKLRRGSLSGKQPTDVDMKHLEDMVKKYESGQLPADLVGKYDDDDDSSVVSSLSSSSRRSRSARPGRHLSAGHENRKRSLSRSRQQRSKACEPQSRPQSPLPISPKLLLSEPEEEEEEEDGANEFAFPEVETSSRHRSKSPSRDKGDAEEAATPPSRHHRSKSPSHDLQCPKTPTKNMVEKGDAEEAATTPSYHHRSKSRSRDVQCPKTPTKNTVEEGHAEEVTKSPSRHHRSKSRSRDVKCPKTPKEEEEAATTPTRRHRSKSRSHDLECPKTPQNTKEEEGDEEEAATTPSHRSKSRGRPVRPKTPERKEITLPLRPRSLSRGHNNLCSDDVDASLQRSNSLSEIGKKLSERRRSLSLQSGNEDDNGSGYVSPQQKLKKVLRTVKRDRVLTTGIISREQLEQLMAAGFGIISKEQLEQLMAAGFIIA